MNNIKIFKNSEFGKVRTVEVNGDPWMVGKDIAEILGYQNVSKALSDHVDSEDKLNNESLLSLGQRGGWIINESGLYSLVLSSKLPKAKEFKRWVTKDVLPTIRKYGMYATDQLLNNPDFMIEVFQKLKNERECNKKLQADNQYKSQIILGFNRDLSLAEMRQVLNRVVRKVPKYSERWAELYKQFNMKYHMNVQQRARGKSLNTLEYIEKDLCMLPELFDIACKLYESEVGKLVQDIYNLRAS